MTVTAHPLRTAPPASPRFRTRGLLLILLVTLLAWGGVPAVADTTAFAEFAIPGAGDEPNSIRDVAVGFGAVWVMDGKTPSGVPTIHKVDPETGAVIASFTAVTAGMGGLIAGTDAIWYNLEGDTEGAGTNTDPGETIGRLDPDTGAITEFTLPTDSGPARIAEGFGYIWYTGIPDNVIGRLDPDTGDVVEYPIPTAGAAPAAITVGPDYVWFGEVDGEKIGQLDPATGVITEYPLGHAVCCSVAVAFDAVWTTAHQSNLVIRLDPLTGAVSEYEIPTEGSAPLGLVAGPYNSVWFTELNGNKIGRLDPTTGSITEYDIPTAESRPFGIAAGSIWFVETEFGVLGRLHVDRFADDDGIFETHIEWMAEQEITLGCKSEGTLYCPDDSVTRAQMASFLVRALDLPAVAGNRFMDVSGTHLANINALAEAEVTLGCNADGTLYCPDDLVTRAQMGSFLARALELDPIPGDRFDDVSGTHEANINAIAEAGITLGCNPEGALYCPDAFVTRGQMAAFLFRGLAD
jgi:virginiamycin B lyase